MRSARIALHFTAPVLRSRPSKVSFESVVSFHQYFISSRFTKKRRKVAEVREGRVGQTGNDPRRGKPDEDVFSRFSLTKCILFSGDAVSIKVVQDIHHSSSRLQMAVTAYLLRHLMNSV